MPYTQRGRSNGRPRLNGRPVPGGSRGRNQRPTSFKQGRGPKKANIAASRFINKAEIVEQSEYTAENSFTDFGFSTALQRNLERKGYKEPSAIQDQAMKPILNGHDIIGLANTGTGKTAAFLLPLIQRQVEWPQRPSVLIIAPTRELAQQIKQELRDFSEGMNLYSALLVGGMNIDKQIRELKRWPHFIVGTPGRINDLLERRELQLKNIACLVLDEADRMLDMGFLPMIRRIVAQVPSGRQTLFFSATMTEDIRRLTGEYLRDPVLVSVRTSETSDHVEQDVIRFEDKDHKLELLTHMLSQEEYDKVLVFGETKYGVQRLSEKLNRMGVSSEAIHGNKSQAQRQRALSAFKNMQVKVLVATDVAARGLDIPNVSHVINFDTPQTYEDYIHRIGRTGRAGARGRAHTFLPKNG